MSDVAIRIEHLGKAYRITHAHSRPAVVQYKTLQEDLLALPRRAWSVFRRPRSARASRETIWALKDVSLDIRAGEIVGIIGRNGAGKSTLLKILSRITEPTVGRAEVYGRVASLLEVGTGFHPELTGRENVFLNGAVLGMRRREIASQFDAIVAFAEVEQFIDTPVKFYSSGMYVRLAFAVAAHLEPEILVVDEVLAVGDAGFQKKCLGKMGEVARGGRTVLFVSHNIGVVQQLCSRGVLLDRGGVLVDDTAAAAIARYLDLGLTRNGERVWSDVSDAPGIPDMVRLHAIYVRDSANAIRTLYDVKEPVHIDVEYVVLQARYALNVHLYFRDDTGRLIFVSMDNLDSPYRDSTHPAGHFVARCAIPADFLAEGYVRVEYLICTRPTGPNAVSVPDAVSFQVTDDRSPLGVRGDWVRDWPNALVRPRLHWIVRRATA